MLLGSAKQLDSPPCYGVQNKQASRELGYRECARLASITEVLREVDRKSPLLRDK